LESALRIPALSPGWKSSLQALLDRGTSESGNPGLTGSTAAPPAWSGFRSLRVAKVEPESASVRSLSFEPIEGPPLPAALPGQFLVLRLHIKPGLPPILRNYSISSAPGSNAYRVSVKQEVNGAGSSFLHNQVNAGDVLEVSAPRGAFTLQPGEEPVVLMSAGIGATPVLAMLHALASVASPREVWWLYGARNRNEHPFAKESRELLQSLAHGHRHIVYSRPQPDDQLGVDYDSPGHLDTSLLDQHGVTQNADFYLCGPPSFLSSFTRSLVQRGVDSSRIHTEIFGPQESITPGIAPASRPAAHPPSGTPGTGPQVSFTRSGLTVPWNPSFHSLLELAEACDVPVRWSCRTGVCHTCESALIGGAVDYQIVPLEPPGEGNLLICCSQPNGEVEIDL
jgi:ferredoxin-NADP reductase